MKKLSLILISLFLFTVFIQAAHLTVTNENKEIDTGELGYNDNTTSHGILVENNSNLKIKADNFSIERNYQGIVVDKSTMTCIINKEDGNLYIQDNIKDGIYLNNNAYAKFDGKDISNIFIDGNKENGFYIKFSTFSITGFKDTNVININVKKSTNGVKFEGGLLITDNITFSNNKRGIFSSEENNEIEFRKLSFEANDYGIFSVSKNLYLEGTSILSSIDIKDNTEVGIYSSQNSNILINTKDKKIQKIYGMGNKVLLMADSGGKITISDSKLFIGGEGQSGNTTGVLVKGENSRIQTADIEAKYNNSGLNVVKIEEGGFFTANDIVADSNNIVFNIENGSIEANDIVAQNNSIAINIKNGSMTARNITLNNNDNGIIGLSEGNNSLQFNELNINNDTIKEYGIKSEELADMKINGNDIKISSTITGIYSAKNSTITINSQIRGINNNTLLKTEGGNIFVNNEVLDVTGNIVGLHSDGSQEKNSLIKVKVLTSTGDMTTLIAENAGMVITDDINISTNSLSSIQIKQNAGLTSKNITITNTYNAILITTGTVKADTITISNGKDNNGNDSIGISVDGINNELLFKTLILENNSYGIALNSKEKANLNIGQNGAKIYLIENKIAGIYSGKNSTITINNQIEGTGNEALLKAEDGGEIYVNNELNISSNSYGLFSMASNSLIQVSTVTIKYSTKSAIRMENGGAVITDSSTLSENNIGIEIVGNGKDISKLTNSKVILENNSYGLKVSSNDATLEIFNSTITFNSSIVASINVSNNASLIISSSLINGRNNSIFILADNNGNINLNSELTISNDNNNEGIRLLNNSELHLGNELNVTKSSQAVNLKKNSKFVFEYGSVANINNNENGICISGGSIIGNGEKSNLNLEHNEIGIKIEDNEKNNDVAIIKDIETLDMKYNKHSIYVNEQDFKIDMSNISTLNIKNSTVAFYAINHATITIDGNKAGMKRDISSNGCLLRAENYSYINLKRGDIREISGGQVGIYSLNNSLIDLDFVQTSEQVIISNKENGVIVQDGGRINVKNGYLIVSSNTNAGILIKGLNSNINTKNTIISKNNQYGLMLSSNAVLNMDLKTTKLKMYANQADIYVTYNSTMTILGGSNQEIEEGIELSKILLKAEQGFIEVKESFVIKKISNIGALSTGEKSVIKFDKSLTLSEMNSYGLFAQNGGKIIVSSNVSIEMGGIGIYSEGENSLIEIDNISHSNSSVSVEKIVSAVAGGSVSIATLTAVDNNVINDVALSAENAGKITVGYAQINTYKAGIQLKDGGYLDIKTSSISKAVEAVKVIGKGNKISSTNMYFENNNYAISVTSNVLSELTIEKSTISLAGNTVGIYSGANGKVIIGEGVVVEGDGVLFNTDRGVVEISETANKAISGSSVAIKLANGGKLSIKDTLTLSSNTTGVLIDNTMGSIEGGELNIISEAGQAGVKIVSGTLSIAGTSIKSLTAGKAAIESEGKSTIIISRDTEIEESFISAKDDTEIRIQSSNLTGVLKDEGKKINVKIDSKSKWLLNADAQVKAVTITGGGVIKIGGKSDSSVSAKPASVIGEINKAVENGGYNVLKVSDLINNSSEKAIINFNVDLNKKEANVLEIEGGEIRGKYKLEIEYEQTGGDIGGGVGTVVKLISTTVRTSTNRDKPFYYWEEKDGYDMDLYQGTQLGGLGLGNKIGNSESDKFSWYLVQSEIRTDAFKTINNTPEVLSLVFKSGMNSLNRRLGDIRRTPEDSYSGVWARGFGKNYDVTNEIKTQVDIFGVEGGYDFRVKKESEDRYYLGLMVGYQSVGSIKTQQTNGGSDGHGDGSAPSFGAYGSWIGKSGYFVDLAIRYFMIDLNMTSYSREDDAIEYKPKANYIGFSGEFGKEFEIDINENKLRVEPKIEMVFGTAGSQSMETTSGTKLEYGGTTIMNGKLKVAGSYQFELDNEMLIEPIIELGYGTEMAGKTDITYGKGKYTSDFSGGYFEVSGGLNAYLTKGFSAYSLVTMESGDNQSNFGWNIGVRYGFGGNKQIAQDKDKSKEKAKKKEKEKKRKGTNLKKSNKTKGKNVSGNKKETGKNNIKAKVVKEEEKDFSGIEKVVIRKEGIREVTIDGKIEEKEISNKTKVGENELTQGQKEYIVELAKGLAKEEIEAIGIAGYVVDISGEETENKKNSVIKAKRVKQIMVKCGIEADKIKVRGYGSKKPVASNKTKEGRYKNDRIEIFIKR